MAMVMVTVRILLVAPTVVGFGLAFLEAVIFCVWLDRHPVA